MLSRRFVFLQAAPVQPCSVALHNRGGRPSCRSRRSGIGGAIPGHLFMRQQSLTTSRVAHSSSTSSHAPRRPDARPAPRPVLHRQRSRPSSCAFATPTGVLIQLRGSRIDRVVFGRSVFQLGPRRGRGDPERFVSETEKNNPKMPCPPASPGFANWGPSFMMPAADSQTSMRVHSGLSRPAEWAFLAYSKDGPFDQGILADINPTTHG